MPVGCQPRVGEGRRAETSTAVDALARAAYAGAHGVEQIISGPAVKLNDRGALSWNGPI
jgi:hypothetical protein